MEHVAEREQPTAASAAVLFSPKETDMLGSILQRLEAVETSISTLSNSVQSLGVDHLLERVQAILACKTRHSGPSIDRILRTLSLAECNKRILESRIDRGEVRKEFSDDSGLPRTFDGDTETTQGSRPVSRGHRP